MKLTRLYLTVLLTIILGPILSIAFIHYNSSGLSANNRSTSTINDYDEVVIDGMTYVKFEDSHGGIAVVNITKDKLEVQLIKKQIQTK